MYSLHKAVPPPTQQIYSDFVDSNLYKRRAVYVYKLHSSALVQPTEVDIDRRGHAAQQRGSCWVRAREFAEAAVLTGCTGEELRPVSDRAKEVLKSWSSWSSWRCQVGRCDAGVCHAE